MNPKVDEFLNRANKWQEELSLLRATILDCGLTEELKWKVPCYTFQKSNIVLIHGFKEYCAIAFFKGALLKDSEGLLIQQTENVQSGRQIRFTSVNQIQEMIPTIKAYIFEAIEVEKAGLSVELKKTSDYPIVEELQKKMDQDAAFKKAFEALTPGRQRGYHLFFSAAKQSKTREDRIENSLNRIFKGKGLTDCICGLSKKMPSCDGSHKSLK